MEDAEVIAGELSSLKTDIMTMFKDGHSKGWVLHVSGPAQHSLLTVHLPMTNMLLHAQVPELETEKNLGYFFVDFHVISDYKGHRAFTGTETKSSYPCSHCNLKVPVRGDTGVTVDFERDWPERIIKPVFDISLRKYHACGMHCHHRITERLLYEVMLTVWRDPVTNASVTEKRINSEVRNEYQKRLLEILNIDLNVHGGLCNFTWNSMKKKLNKIGLNGTECTLILKRAADFAALAYPENMLAQTQLIALWNQWLVVHENLSDFRLNEATVQLAISSGKNFVRKYHAMYCQDSRRYPDYMHLLYKHAEWFWGLDKDGKLVGPPAWWSTTGLEKSHSTHKRALRWKTCKGMKIRECNEDGEVQIITQHPGIYQLFQWRIRMYAWRWREHLLNRKAAVRRITVADVVMLFQMVEFGATAADPVGEDEVRYMMGLPDACTIHIVGYGKVPPTVKINIHVTAVNRAAVDKIQAVSGSTVQYKRMHRQHHAVALLDPEKVEQQRLRKFQKGHDKAAERAEHEGLDLSFLKQHDAADPDAAREASPGAAAAAAAEEEEVLDLNQRQAGDSDADTVGGATDDEEEEWEEDGGEVQEEEDNWEEEEEEEEEEPAGGAGATEMAYEAAGAAADDDDGYSELGTDDED
jgi:hypothetical protein